MMRKLINTSFYYALMAMVGGVFFREFTKFNDFTGKTTLSIVHLHLFALGMLFFLVVTLLEKNFKLSSQKKFKLFYYLFNIGLHITVIIFLIRGVLSVLEIELNTGLSSSISGIAGIGHALIGVGLVIFFIILRSVIGKETKE